MAGIAIVGCGYVADRYMESIGQHAGLRLVGAYDRNAERAQKFSACHGVRRYETLDELLADGKVAFVLNLTNPRSHFEVSRACLLAGKHVYSEKPLATDLAEAKQLVDLAAARRLWISAAPCSLLGETAQTVWRALRHEEVGPVRVVYAELDDGLVHLMPYQRWISKSGAPWPYEDEFEVGCTLEHAGYYLTWLLAFFGPVQRMSAWGSVQVPDKLAGTGKKFAAPDLTVACMQFESGVTARLTCSILAPHDHQLRIVGDRGILSTEDCWKYRSPVSIKRMQKFRRRQFFLPWGKRYPLVGSPELSSPSKGGIRMDWCRGVADMAEAVRDGRKPRLAPDFCLHVTEVALAISASAEQPGPIPITTRFEPVDPMPWAK
jgi:predicted dehydrogenase